MNCNPIGIENAGKFPSECLDATHEKHRNLNRERLIGKFPRGWTSCYFPPKLSCRKISRGDGIVQKSYVFPPFQRGAKTMVSEF
jgi:hypothetical protein